jgi:hypothetical protein
MKEELSAWENFIFEQDTVFTLFRFPCLVIVLPAVSLWRVR